MNNALNTIAKSAENLSKNPLGIIGLFIVLVYGIAGLVLITTNELGNSKQYLVWFLILFPVLILWTFYNLVTKHYSKLYAPSDYQDESNFMKAIDMDTGSVEINDTKTINKDFIEIQESLNTLNLIEEQQNRIEEITLELSKMRNNKTQKLSNVEEKFKEERELLEQTRSIVNWKGSVVHVNKLLDDSEHLITKLQNSGVGNIKFFGIGSQYEFNPDIRLLTFGNNITISQVQEMLALAIEFNFEYVNITKADGNSNGIYFGSYGYSRNKVAKISDLPLNQILNNDSITTEALDEIISSKAVYDLTKKAILHS